MKSSKAGDDERCKEQIKHAEFFLTYLLESALYAEEIKKKATNKVSEYIFIKLLFIPDKSPAISLPTTVNAEADNSNPPFDLHGKTNYHLLDMQDTTQAKETWASIKNRFPANTRA
jgi:hypothetical protein